jgi:hypothetical protein
MLILVTIPAYAQEQSEQQTVLTDKGTLEVGLSTIPAQPHPGEQTKLKIDFINKSTKVNQDHVDYSITITKGNEQVFGIPLNHVGEGGSITIPFEFQNSGEYKISVNVQGIVFQPIPTETASFTISVGKESQPKNGCLIATATFGSEIAPQVQFLREYRDNTIMSTVIGSSFINAFNSVYYTFSPAVADVERNNPLLQESIKVGITPLLEILQITKLSTIGNGELSVLTSGMMASSLIGATYLWPVGLVTKSIRENSRNRIKIVLTIISIAVLLTLILNSIGNVQFMMISTSVLVLSLIGSGAMFSSWAIWKIVQKIKITFL